MCGAFSSSHHASKQNSLRAMKNRNAEHLIHFSRTGTLHNNEEAEMAVRERLRMEKLAFLPRKDSSTRA